MNKAILVLNEMPKSCIECKLSMMYGTFCLIKGDTYVSEGRKSDDCPLKEMPKIKKPKDPDETWEEMHHRFGYNDCIIEILGELDETTSQD